MKKAFHKNTVPVFTLIAVMMFTFAIPVPPAAAAEAISGFVYIQPGSFQMGSISGFADEQPVHTVTISTGFYIGITEVTQKEWYDVMGTKPWAGRQYVKDGDSYPATYVSWNDVQAFIDAKNAEGTYNYRLPTEAEWEYACRAGTATVFSFGDEPADLGTFAWYCDNAWDADEQWPHQVKTRAANPWGLYDMHGNVWEWCQDWYGTYSSDSETDPTGPAAGVGKVIRGGAYDSGDGSVVGVEGCTSSNRLLQNPVGYAWADTGFRLVIGTISNDSDGDGVPNDVDEFPDDATKATIAAAPGTGKITIAVTSPDGAKLTNITVL
ncbi:MAG: formylglycine-generating enzyme family protein, partial [Deltaproteobacteria bacterium]|nr:formylglycine-generating enzyme family protein [Deltaproteobacteria bacterium]